MDAEFCCAFVVQKLDFQARLEDVLQGAVKPSSSLPSPGLARANARMQ